LLEHRRRLFVREKVLNGSRRYDCPVWWIGWATPNALGSALGAGAIARAQQGRLRFTHGKTITARIAGPHVASNLLRATSFDYSGPVVRACKAFAYEHLQDEKEASMTRSLILGAAAVAFSGVAASAQAVYVSPGYVAVPTYAAPAYVAPSFVAPPAYVAPSAPIYGYGPGVLDAAEPDGTW
jgi:hypothetical protein